ncbi:hypothetical protein BT96DRAFT_1102673 [Gymnopus androsaceus JB14]|uniref:Uncharacterized protein n=1 Tax=Gymnopus androsaceus JB14 TaxID=1447944 RepID=A0A6A4HRK5_9AGAR|nr:hypothetical protein BT96DRAFT_1102673 [Gymnopus androsaceus JB14]
MVELEITCNNTRKVISTCPWYHSFQYKAASKLTTANPSTNVPIICTICHPEKPNFNKSYSAVWKYNFTRHIQLHHPSLWDDTINDVIEDLQYIDLWNNVRVPQSEKDTIIAWARKRAETGGAQKRQRTNLP